jgi:hypothetical protein
MKKLIFMLMVISTFTTAIAAPPTIVEERGCRHWYIRIFGYQILDHANDACNTGRNWNWF